MSAQVIDLASRRRVQRGHSSLQTLQALLWIALAAGTAVWVFAGYGLFRLGMFLIGR